LRYDTDEKKVDKFGITVWICGGWWRYWRMVSSGMLRRMALVRTDLSEEPGASFIKVTNIGELGTTQAATSNRRTLRRNISSQRTSVASCSLCCS
jgi:hypothetical protein